MDKYDCPHCGKFTFRTFCEHCGEPTKSLWKYRLTHLIGLIIVPSVFYVVTQGAIRIIPQLDSIYGIEDLTSLFILPSGLMAILSIYFLIDHWIEIEQKFHAYRKRKRGGIYGK